MRTTIDLPDALVNEALRCSPQKTKTSLIITALEEYIRKNKIQELKNFKGKIKIDLDLNTIRKRV